MSLFASENIQTILCQDSKQLETVLGLDPHSARIEVQCLLQSVLQVNRAWLLTHSEQSLKPEQHVKYAALLSRRLNGEPVAYLLGEREFYGLMFKVTPDTLIPRPDTELLVDLALQHIPQSGTCRILDMGTGSGAVALSIAHECPAIEMVAVEASLTALEIAKENARRLNLRNVQLRQSNWFCALQDEKFDIIVSNPPYIAENDQHLSQGDVRFEPISALVSGPDGLDDIRHIIDLAQAHLNKEGWLMLEHGFDQANQVQNLLKKAGFAEVFAARDIASIERVSLGKS